MKRMRLQIPIVADVSKSIAADYGVLIKEGGATGIALRGLFLINPEVKQPPCNPAMPLL